MQFELFLARRSLFRRQSGRFVGFIRLLAITGLSIGTIALSLTAGILNGFEKNLIEKITGFDAHIRSTSLNHYRLKTPEKIREKLETVSEIQSIAPYASQEAMLKSQFETEGILLEGMLPEDFAVIQAPSKTTLTGRPFQNIDEIYLGKGVAKSIRAEVGDTVQLIIMKGTPSIFNPLQRYPVRVSGIFTTGMMEYDANLVYCHLSLAQKVFQMDDQISGFQLILERPEQTDKIAAKIQDILGYPYFHITWREQHQTLFRWLETQKLPILIVFGLIALVAFVNLLSTLVMIILAKEHEIAILQAIGMSSRRIQILFLTDGLLLGTIGIIIGLSVALLLQWIQMHFGLIHISADVYFIDNVPILISPIVILIISLSGLLLSGLAAWYPARKASKIRPVELLRYE
ncbi:MAG TPA: ABC transporter permease [Candidatus Marinimicrobia bacterium]|nr:ABC transporter permease [Candidatus Neomarinimicrobiota bacterium]